MTRSPLTTDFAIALIAAILILVLTPGVAVAGMIALLVLLACAVNLILDSRRRRPAASPRRGPVPDAQPRRRERVPRTGR